MCYTCNLTKTTFTYISTNFTNHTMYTCWHTYSPLPQKYMVCLGLWKGLSKEERPEPAPNPDRVGTPHRLADSGSSKVSHIYRVVDRTTWRTRQCQPPSERHLDIMLLMFTSFLFFQTNMHKRRNKLYSSICLSCHIATTSFQIQHYSQESIFSFLETSVHFSSHCTGNEHRADELNGDKGLLNTASRLATKVHSSIK